MSSGARRPPASQAMNARRRTWPHLALASLLCAAVASADGNVSSFAHRWEYQGREDGVAIWTSETGSTSLGAFKVVTRFALRPQALVATLRDVARYPRWYQDCAQTRMLRAPRQAEPVVLDRNGKFVVRKVEESYVLFFLQHASMLDDRWAVIENTSRVRVDGSLEVAFRSRDNYPYPAPSGAVRMSVAGEWVLTPVDHDHTQVSYTVDIDLRTTTPNFLVRPKVQDAAKLTLLALGKAALQRR
jgi:hypothetical protein